MLLALTSRWWGVWRAWRADGCWRWAMRAAASPSPTFACSAVRASDPCRASIKLCVLSVQTLPGVPKSPVVLSDRAGIKAFQLALH